MVFGGRVEALLCDNEAGADADRRADGEQEADVFVLHGARVLCDFRAMESITREASQSEGRGSSRSDGELDVERPALLRACHTRGAAGNQMMAPAARKSVAEMRRIVARGVAHGSG